MLTRLNRSGSTLAPIFNAVERQSGGERPSVEQKGGFTDIPLGDLPAAVFGDTLQIEVFAVAPGAKACDANTHFSASISKGADLDMGGAADYTTPPNLLLFENAGFSFTCLADLGQEAVLLPSSPTLDEMTSISI